MKKSKWLVLAVALGMMAATGSYLVKVHQRTRLGEPGVKVGPGRLYDEGGHQVADHCVILPEAVSGITGDNMPITHVEVEDLPKDTTFGRKIYTRDFFSVLNTVVLMGTDRTSIHDPQYCLVAQGWHIDKTDYVQLPMEHPYPYEAPALRVTVSRKVKTENGNEAEVRGFYVYWFVSGDRLTSDAGTRMWSIARTMVQKGVLERWAYISYFTACLPGQEDSTYNQLERFIRASVPEFQTVAGQPAQRSPIVTR